MEDYKEKYQIALNRAELCYDNYSSQTKDVIGYIFPELTESEDEKIMKELTEFLKSASGGFLDTTIQCKTFGKWLTWLEKQDKLDDNIITRDDEILQAISVGLTDIVEDAGWSDFGGIPIEEIQDWIEKQGDKDKLIKELGEYKVKYTQEVLSQQLEKQGEQKPSNVNYYHVDDEVGNPNDWVITTSHDKVEPKFKNGQWIVWQDKCYKVNYNGCGYELVDQNGLSTSLEYGTVDENAHLWDITKDAKDGDVLYSLDSKQPFIFKHRKPNEQAKVYCGINIYGKFFVGNTKDCIITTDKYIPAAKEQRDLLFAKMEEAGWKWNAEKKGLKKIEDEIEIPFGAKDSELQEETYYIPKGFHAEIEADKVVIKKGEKSAAWSDEDEIALDDALWCCKQAASIAKDENDMGNIWYAEHWLKSLKERIGG